MSLKRHLIIRNLVGRNDNSDLTAGLNRKALLNTLKARSDFFKFLDSFNVCLYVCARMRK